MNAYLSEIINNAENFLLIGDSSSNRFPAMSFHCYTEANKSFHCIDLGGLKESRGFSGGLPVLNSIEELPEGWSGKLAIIWVLPVLAAECTRMAASVGCTQVWYSFQTASPEALKVAEEHGMEVIECGRCPVYFFEGAKPLPCRMHTAAVKLTGTIDLPRQLDLDADRRELL
jgi:predicted CoA-binding protein